MTLDNNLIKYCIHLKYSLILLPYIKLKTIVTFFVTMVFSIKLDYNMHHVHILSIIVSIQTIS